jgi:2-dehydro-3-deoxyphosphogluconate aldolase/(4S)-4-hydroxy-2-oxoglutarate aldolase
MTKTNPGTMHDAHRQLVQYRIIPVVQIARVEQALPLVEALAHGGLPLVEVTLRSDCALSAISEIAAAGNILVGAGTVLDEAQCRAALEAGAHFIVSPGLDQAVIETCMDAGIACYPGVATATEVLQARNFGLQTVKFFPAESFGGVATIQALSGPFPDMRFIPTGGIGPGNASQYLALPSVVAIGGSWMTREELYQDGNFAAVNRLTKAAAALV